MALVVYPLKKAVLTPRTAWRRHQQRDLDPAFRRAFENNYYSPAFYGYIGHIVHAPRLMVEFGLTEDDVAFDVGSYDGSWSQNLWDESRPTIYAFEPAPRQVERSRELLRDHDRIHVLPYGLGGADTTASLGLSAAGSSLHNTGAMGTEEVQVRDVVKVLDELGIERLSLIKLNIEGAEYDLLERMIDGAWLERTDRVLVQFHEWVPHAHRRRWNIRRALRGSHGEVWNYPWVWEYWQHRSI